MRWLLSPYAQWSTYSTLCYLLAGLPVAVIGFSFTMVGLVVGVGMLATLAGIPILIAVIGLLHQWAALERAFARSALGVTSAARQRTVVRRSNWWLRGLSDEVRHPSTWREIAWVIARLPLGIAGFAAAVLIVSLMVGGFAQPIVYLARVDNEIGSWQIDTFVESLMFVPASVVFCLLGPRMLLGVGHLMGGIADRLLGYVDRAELSAVIEAIIAEGPIGSFDLYRVVEGRLGRGPWLSTVRVEAALLDLEASRRVVRIRDTHDATYSATSAAPEMAGGRSNAL